MIIRHKTGTIRFQKTILGIVKLKDVSPNEIEALTQGLINKFQAKNALQSMHNCGSVNYAFPKKMRRGCDKFNVSYTYHGRIKHNQIP